MWLLGVFLIFNFHSMNQLYWIFYRVYIASNCIKVYIWIILYIRASRSLWFLFIISLFYYNFLFFCICLNIKFQNLCVSPQKTHGKLRMFEVADTATLSSRKLTWSADVCHTRWCHTFYHGRNGRDIKMSNRKKIVN